MVNLISLHPNKENVLILPFVGHFKIDKIIQYTQFIYIILVQPFCTLAGKKKADAKILLKELSVLMVS